MNKIILSIVTLGLFLSLSFKNNDPISDCKVVKSYIKNFSTTTKADGSFDTKVSHFFRKYDYNPNGSLNTITDSSSISQKNRIRKFIYNPYGHLEIIKSPNGFGRDQYIKCDAKGNIFKISSSGMHSSSYTDFIYENERVIKTKRYQAGQSGEYLMNKVTYLWAGDNITSSIDSSYIHGDTLYMIKIIEFPAYHSSINPDYLLSNKTGGVNPIDGQVVSKNNYESYNSTTTDCYVVKGKRFETKTFNYDLTHDESNKLIGIRSQRKDKTGEYLNIENIEYECK